MANKILTRKDFALAGMVLGEGEGIYEMYGANNHYRPYDGYGLGCGDAMGTYWPSGFCSGNSEISCAPCGTGDGLFNAEAFVDALGMDGANEYEE